MTSSKFKAQNSNFSACRPGFTLIELLISTALLLIAFSIALFATLGNNNIVRKTELRSHLFDGARNTADTLRQATTLAEVQDLAIISAVSYAGYPNDDLNPVFTKEPANSTNSGLAVELKQFGRGQKQSVCYVVGRGEVIEPANQEPKFFFDSTGDVQLVVIYALNDTGSCQYSTIHYKGRLTSDKLVVQDFDVMNRKTDYSCSAATCSIGQLRYRLLTEVSDKVYRASRKPSLEVVSSISVGLD